jgi:NhaP-type Na+/H+ or K+/H+ antiporter
MAENSRSELAVAIVVVSAAVILTRFVWTFPATYVPRWLSPALRRRDPAPPWQWPFAIGFTGVRGIVTVAAALAIPITTAAGTPFPHRSLIIFLAFVVVLVTLVGQGLLMAPIMAWLGLANAGRREAQASRAAELKATHQALAAASAELESLAKERDLPQEVLRPLRGFYREQLTNIDHRKATGEHHRHIVELGDEIGLRLIEAERRVINALYRNGELEDEARRRIERALDLREADIANQQSAE